MKSITAAINHFPRSPLHNKQMNEKSTIRRWEFNETICPWARVGYEMLNSKSNLVPNEGLVGYEIGNSQLAATRLVGYLPFRIQRGHME